VLFDKNSRRINIVAEARGEELRRAIDFRRGQTPRLFYFGEGMNRE
jgi:hypothetical protein